MDLDHEGQVLKEAFEKHGTTHEDGTMTISYGVLSDKTANQLEALNGTLRRAKRQKKVKFDAEILMFPKDKDVVVTWVGP